MHLPLDDNVVDYPNNNETSLVKDEDASLIALRVLSVFVNDVVLPSRMQSIRTTDDIPESRLITRHVGSFPLPSLPLMPNS
eukprot:6846483-Ditylum_brightwellii.AAC.1